MKKKCYSSPWVIVKHANGFSMKTNTNRRVFVGVHQDQLKKEPDMMLSEIKDDPILIQFQTALPKEEILNFDPNNFVTIVKNKVREIDIYLSKASAAGLTVLLLKQMNQHDLAEEFFKRIEFKPLPANRVENTDTQTNQPENAVPEKR